MAIDGVSDGELFMEKLCRKYAVKASPRPLYNFGTIACKKVLKVRYFERGLSKDLKKGNFIFSFEPSSFQ